MIPVDYALPLTVLLGAYYAKTPVCPEALLKYLCTDKSAIRCPTQDTVNMVARSDMQFVIPIGMLADCLGSTLETPNSWHQCHAYTYQTI